MKKKIFLTVFLCCGMFAAMAQTAADSLAIVSANWQTEPLQKGMLYKRQYSVLCMEFLRKCPFLKYPRSTTVSMCSSTIPRRRPV